MPPFDIYFTDLNKTTQEAYLEFAGLSSAAEGNLDVIPLVTLKGPEPELTEFKLYSPLSARLFGSSGGDSYAEYDEGIDPDAPDELSGSELTMFRDDILKMIRNESLPEEAEHGLIFYFSGDSAVSQKVVSAFPTVEEYDGQLWGVLKCELTEPLTPEEKTALVSFWIGQAADGWGEGFEQRPIKTEYGELFVSFWQSDNSYCVKTESELKEPSSRIQYAPAKLYQKPDKDAR